MLLLVRVSPTGCTSGHGLSGMAGVSGRLDLCGRRDVRGRYRDCNALAAPHLRKKRRLAVSVLVAIVVGVAMGIVFGFALEKSRL